MSVDELQPRRPPRPPGDAKLVRYDAYIDKQIRTTSRAVKAVDFATAIVLLAAGVLAFLLTAAVVEHWLLPGGFNFVVRCVLFGLLVCGAGYFAYRRLWPLCVWAINPVYAAQTIEHGSPSLKNSLINLLLFRQRRSDVSDAVYQTLEEQAAQRLTRVPVDSAVDRSQLIRFGYVLLAVVAAGALYKVFSPKDPLIAAERLLLPWADIVPASRVSITGVEPGRVTITRGEFLDVSAEVLGIDESDPVLLRFTTADGRAVDKPITMKPSNAGLRFVGRLPDSTEESGSTGVAQNLTYRIEAGDARTLDYPVTVIAAPAILVERVDFDYPQYTGYPDRSVEASRDVPDPGHIRAIEGTRVTIHARANGPIDTADVDFDADGRRDLRMSTDGQRAKAAFELALRDDRQTPKHLSYVLRLTNDEGRTNRDPVKHPIEVVPDYSPEVAILSPPEKSLNVRLDDTIVIEIEARDPDFALSGVRLRGEAPGRPKFDVPLLEKEHAGKFTGRYRFTPRGHNLQVGDVVQYWAAADDIRAPKSNSTATEKRIFRIMSPDPAGQPPPDRIAQRDQRQQPGGGQQGQQGQQQEGGQGQQGSEGNQGGENSKPQKSKDRQGQSGQSGGEGESASGDGKADGKNGAGDDAPQSQEQNGEQNQQGSGEQKSDGKQTGAGAAGGESSQQDSQPGGARPDQGQSSQGAGGNQRNAAPSESKPVSPEGDDDGSAFERIREHMQRRGEMKDGESASADGKPKQSGDSTSGGDQKQEGTERSPTGDTHESFSRDAQRSANKGDPKQEQKQNGQSTQADSAEDNTPRTDDQGEGTGADTRQDDVPGQDKPPAETGEKTKSPGGQQTSTKGPSGAGEQPGENQGVPDSKEGMKPADKRQQSPSQESTSDDKEPPAPGEGKRESDSQGEMGGDRPGGGEEGGGQKANRDGTGSAGQNQSADEGAGESSEKGTGNNSPNAGQDATADRRTGQPGSDKSGPGSKQQDGKGNQPGGKSRGEEGPALSGEKPQEGDQRGKENKPGESASADGKQNQDGSKPTGGTGAPTGSGGDTGTSGGPPPAADGTAPDGDAANLEYARRQTDLVLEKLADQLNRKRVDERMLKELGWSEDDLRAFVERWQRRKDAARNADPAADAARRELDDALRSLGLRRGTLRQNKATEDRQRDLREGYRGPVPLEYQERLRAYNQGISRARQEGE